MSKKIVVQMNKLLQKGIVIIGGVTTFNLYVCDTTYGLGRSMEPTIPDGSLLLIDRLSLRWSKLKHGDIVVVRSPTRSNGATICKRILGLPGDTVTLQPRYDMSREATIIVPKGHVWIEGDNASMSVDSRQIGAVPQALVLGRVYCLIWPFHRSTIF